MNKYVKRFLQLTDNWKDKVQYTTAVASFAAGVGMGYLSFLTSGTISGEILGFIGECFTLAGGIFGVTLYIRNKVAQAGVYIIQSAKDVLEGKAEEYYKDDEDTDDTKLDKES